MLELSNYSIKLLYTLIVENQNLLNLEAPTESLEVPLSPGSQPIDKVKLSSIRHLLNPSPHALRLPGTNPDGSCLRCRPRNPPRIRPQIYLHD
jgi:hypothetical protein